MKIVTVLENFIEKGMKNLKVKSGLSLYIEADNMKILYDVGPGIELIRNCETLNIDLKEIDLVVLSHAHDDHCGGLKYFLENNKKAKVLVNKHFFDEYYFDNKKENCKEYIGLDKDVAAINKDRFEIHDDEIYYVTENISVASNASIINKLTENNLLLLKKEHNIYIQDEFHHEQYLIINEKDKIYLFSGCSHCGIENIITDIKRKYNIEKVDYFIGGLHLVDNPGLLKPNPLLEEDLEKVAFCLDNNVNSIYTCHCTGKAPYLYLKSKLDEKIEYIKTGKFIAIND